RVLPDCAVARELAHPRRVEDRLAGPPVLVAVRGVDPLLAVAVGPEVRKHHVGVAAPKERALDGSERSLLARNPVVASQPVHDGPDLLIVPVEVPRIVAALAPRLDLLDLHP